MPYHTPDASAFTRIKRIDVSQTANSNSTHKVGIISPYNIYFPLFRSVKLPVNKLISNKFITSTDSSTSAPSVEYQILIGSATTIYGTTDLKTFTTLGTIPTISTPNGYFIDYIPSISTFSIGDADYTKMCLSTNNGLTWSSIGNLLPNTSKVLDVYYTSNKYYVLSHDRIYSSTNSGSTWTQVVYFSPSYYSNRMLVRGTNFIVIGPRLLWTSTDGTTFTDRNSSVGNTQYSLCNPLYYNGTYYLFGRDFDSNRNFRLTTTDLATFSRTNLPATTYKILGIRRNPSTGILVGIIAVTSAGTDAGIKWSSDDGLTWTDSTGSVASNYIKIASSLAITNDFDYSCYIKFTGSMFIASMSDNTLHYSTDGKIWTAVSGLPSTTIPFNIGFQYNDESGQY